MTPTLIKVTIMTNEEILKLFLKQKRLYKSFCEQRNEKRIKLFDSSKNVSFAIDAALLWAETKEGYNRWYKTNKVWKEMCYDFKLKGRIDLMKV